MRLYAIAFLVLAFLPSCVGITANSREYRAAGLRGFDAVSAVSVRDAQEIAALAANELARRYPPGRTQMRLPSLSTPFAQALESDLRSHGFAIAEASGSGVPVNYILDLIREPNGLALNCYLKVWADSDDTAFGLVRRLGAASAPQTAQRHKLNDNPIKEK